MRSGARADCRLQLAYTGCLGGTNLETGWRELGIGVNIPRLCNLDTSDVTLYYFCCSSFRNMTNMLNTIVSIRKVNTCYQDYPKRIPLTHAMKSVFIVRKCMHLFLTKIYFLSRNITLSLSQWTVATPTGQVGGRVQWRVAQAPSTTPGPAPTLPRPTAVPSALVLPLSLDPATLASLVLVSQRWIFRWYHR